MRSTRDGGQRIGEHTRRVLAAGEPAFVVLGAAGQLAEPCREGHQGAREVAAVDGRDVARRKRRERGGVVPVEQVSLVPFHRLGGCEGLLKTLHECCGAEVAEVVRGQRREQPHADIGRRGAMGDARLRGLLNVVGR